MSQRLTHVVALIVMLGSSGFNISNYDALSGLVLYTYLDTFCATTGASADAFGVCCSSTCGDEDSLSAMPNTMATLTIPGDNDGCDSSVGEFDGIDNELYDVSVDAADDDAGDDDADDVVGLCCQFVWDDE